MKKTLSNLFILILVLSLSSCGLFQKVFKTSSKFKEDIEVKVNTKSDVKIEDKSKIVISERIDSIITTPKRESVSETPISNIKDIKDLTLISNAFVDIKQNFDSLRNILTTSVLVKPQNVNFELDRKTIIDNNISITKSESKDSLYKKDTKLKTATKSKEPKNVFWYIILVIGVLSAGYFITKKYFKKAI